MPPSRYAKKSAAHTFFHFAGQVHSVLDRISAFVSKVRSGEHVGATGKKLVNVVAIGIGGSQLGPEFVNEALRADAEAMGCAEGRTLR